MHEIRRVLTVWESVFCLHRSVCRSRAKGGIFLRCCLVPETDPPPLSVLQVLGRPAAAVGIVQVLHSRIAAR